MSKMKLALAVIILTVTSLACEEPIQDQNPPGNNPVVLTTSSKDVVLKGDRILELDSNPAEDQDYDLAMDLARELGADSIRLSIYWDDFETSPGEFNPDPNWLEIANQYYSSQGYAISLVISVLDTTETRLPSDLEGRSFSDPEVSERFMGLLDYVKSQLVDVELVSLAIGNEIDGVLGSDQQAWNAYTFFYEESASYARELWPDIPVSTKVTFDGLTGSSGSLGQSIYQNSAVIMTTYYPLNGDFTVQDPTVILDDFSTLVDLFPGKEIQLTEIGYPTSPINNSSPEKQAQFIQNMFQAWDQHAEVISVMSYSWLTDLPEDSVRELETYYGVSSDAFGEFLRTLGLRTFPGAGDNKIGFEVFKAESAARGW
jgi:hypothetical protein